MYADVCISIYTTEGGSLCMNMQQNVSFMTACNVTIMTGITVTCIMQISESDSVNPNALNVFCNQTV